MAVAGKFAGNPFSDRQLPDDVVAFDLEAITCGDDCTKILDEDGNLTYMNKAGVSALGLTEEMYRGRFWLDMLPEEVRGIGRTALAQAAGGHSCHFAGKSIDEDGNVRYWDNHLIPLRGTASGKSILCISRDVTKSIRLQEMLSDFLEKMRDFSSPGLSNGNDQPSQATAKDEGVNLRKLAFSDVALEASDADLAGALKTRLESQLVSFKDDVDESGGGLSKKEQECLFWVGMGKTSFETGIIVGRSPRTIEFHLHNAIRKLGASNKVHAAMIAFSHNLL